MVTISFEPLNSVKGSLRFEKILLRTFLPAVAVGRKLSHLRLYLYEQFLKLFSDLALGVMGSY